MKPARCTAWNDTAGSISAVIGDTGGAQVTAWPLGWWPAPGRTCWVDEAGDGTWVCFGPRGGEGIWNTWTPAWAAAISGPVLGNGTIGGRYCRVGKLVTINLAVVAGSTTSGGLGGWSFGLPVAGTAAAGSSGLVAILSQPAASVWWHGFGFVGASSTAVVPYFTISQTDARLQQGQNADASAATGTGRPAPAGVYPLAVGGSIGVTGSYECA